MVGKPGAAALARPLRGSLVDDLVRGSGDIDVLRDRGRATGRGRRPAAAPRRAGSAVGAPGRWALLVVAAPTALGWRLRGTLELADLVMVYLLGVILVAALRLRRGPSLAAALAERRWRFDFFFVPPVFTFAVSDMRYLSPSR